jgi:hypothetical protein
MTMISYRMYLLLYCLFMAMESCLVYLRMDLQCNSIGSHVQKVIMDCNILMGN